jgi:hypothetical protein
MPGRASRDRQAFRARLRDDKTTLKDTASGGVACQEMTCIAPPSDCAQCHALGLGQDRQAPARARPRTFGLPRVLPRWRGNAAMSKRRLPAANSAPTVHP